MEYCILFLPELIFAIVAIKYIYEYYIEENINKQNYKKYQYNLIDTDLNKMFNSYKLK